MPDCASSSEAQDLGRRLHQDPEVGMGPGAFVGVVSSHHLGEPKVNQLQQYWVKAQAANGNTAGHQI